MTWGQGALEATAAACGSQEPGTSCRPIRGAVSGSRRSVPTLNVIDLYGMGLGMCAHPPSLQGHRQRLLRTSTRSPCLRHARDGSSLSRPGAPPACTHCTGGKQRRRKQTIVVNTWRGREVWAVVRWASLCSQSLNTDISVAGQSLRLIAQGDVGHSQQVTGKNVQMHLRGQILKGISADRCRQMPNGIFKST